MLKLATTAAFLAASLMVSMPGIASAQTQEEFEARCAAEGGTMEGGTCTYPDGKVETCAFGEDQWGCYSYTPGEEDDFGPAPTLKTKFPKLFNIPKKVIKTPIPHGPVIESVSSSKSVKQAPSFKATTTMTSVKVKPMTVTTLKIKKPGN